MTNRLAKICPLLPFALILALGSCNKKDAPQSAQGETTEQTAQAEQITESEQTAQAEQISAFAQTAEAEEHTKTGIKYLHLYDTEDEKAVFRAVHKGMATPVAVNTFELYGEDVSIVLCNITEKTIKEMYFSYTVFDENDRELFSISESLSHEINPYAACTFSIGNPVEVSGWTETIRNKTIRIIFADGSEAALSDDDILSSMEDSLRFCLCKDENVAVWWQYKPAQGRYFMRFEAETLFDYAYFCFKTDEYEDSYGATLDSIEGAFFYDDNIAKDGDVYSETIQMPNYLEAVFTTTKSLEIDYLVKTPDAPDRWNLPEEEKRNLAKKIVIDDTASLERIRSYAAFMGIMGLR